jgi:hypothetical protein
MRSVRQLPASNAFAARSVEARSEACLGHIAENRREAGFEGAY